jgi:hypothetical protein
MATEDLTTYTEVDPNSRITRTATRSTYAALQRDEDAYVYKDKGAAHFSGDFEHLIAVYLDETTQGGLVGIWGLANLVDDTGGIRTASGDELIAFLFDSGGVRYIFLQEVLAGTAYTDLHTISLDTSYYLKIKRDESVGTYGRLYCYVYSDAARTNLLFTLQLDLHEKEDFRYIYVTQSWNEGTTKPQSGYSENLDLQEGGEVKTASAILSGAGSLSAAGTVFKKLLGQNDQTIAASVAADYHWTDKYTAVASGVMDRFRLKCSGSGNVKVAIYADDNGSPGALLNAVNTGQPVVAGWNDIPFPATQITQGNTYWLSFISDAQIVGRWDESGNTKKYKSVSYDGFTFPDPAGSFDGQFINVPDLTAGWQVAIYGAATLSGAGTLLASAKVIRTASATLSGTGSLAASASVIRTASATLSGTGSLSATANLICIGSATLAGTGSLTAQGQVLKFGSAALSGVGALSATAKVIRSASAVLTGTGSLSAAGIIIGPNIYGSATLSGTGSLTASAVAILIGQATLSGQGSLSAQGKCTFVATATFSGQGSLSASATIVLFATAQFSGTGTLSAHGVCIVTASATLSGVGSLAAAGQIFGFLASLYAAQKKPHRLPYVEAKVYDYEQGIKRLSWTRLYEGEEPDNHHGLAFDGQGSLHRIRAAADNKLYYQKITNPDEDSDYSSWQLIANNCSGPCAIAACGSKIYIFYKHNELNQLNKLYSHDYGQTWDDAQLVDYADVLSLAACWWSTGNIVVCFALKSNQLNGIVLDTSDQTTTPHTWSDSNHPLLATYGIGATYNPFWPAIEIVFAGKESDSPYNHYDLFRTKFSNTYNFLALESFLMSPDGEDITYEYPDCHLPSGAQPYETNRIIAVEAFAGTTAYKRPITCHMVKGTYWSDTTFTEPKPFLDISSSYGLRLQSTGDYWWLSMPSGLWRAQRVALDPVDLTKDILSLTQYKNSPLNIRGERGVIIELDNSKGQYSNLAEHSPCECLGFRSEIVLKLGYKTPEGDLALEAGTYWIDSWQYLTTQQTQSTLKLFCLDGWGLMDRWSARYQMRWNKDEVNPKSVWQILYQILARVGICLTNTPPKPQSSAINNFYPDFTVNPGVTGDSAIRRLLSFVPDQLVFRGQEAFTKNPLATESSCYSYVIPAKAGTSGHPILSGQYTQAVTLSRSRALGRDDSDNRILEEALDWDLLQLAIDILEQDYDPNLQTATRAQERADAILRHSSLQAQASSIQVPTNVAQELLDVVEVTDERCRIDQEKYRVQAIQTDYDRRQGIYTQCLALCAP